MRPVGQFFALRFHRHRHSSQLCLLKKKVVTIYEYENIFHQCFKKKSSQFMNMKISFNAFFAFIVFGANFAMSYVTSWHLSNSHAFLTSLLFFFIGELIVIRNKVGKLLEQHEFLVPLIKNLKLENKFSEIIVLYALRAFKKITAGSVTVQKEDVWNFWWDCFSRIKNRWVVISYVDNNEAWNMGWGRGKTIFIQEERIKNGCIIERVFLVDTEDEVEKIHEIAETHQKIGIKVSWCLKQHLFQNEPVKQAYNEIKTLDIALIDDSWVCKTFLNSKRKVTGAEASILEKDVQNADLLISEAFKQSQPFQFNN